MSDQLTSFLIGNVKIDPCIALAPMEDVSNLAFRIICKEIGAPGLVVSEFVSAMAAHYNPNRALHKMAVDPRERPVSVQIFGAEPEVMANAAQMAEAQGADIVDINMGCWVPKVCKTGSGAALLKDPAAAEAVVSAVVNAVKIPVTVKVRAGWHRHEFTAPELAKRLEQCGISALALHARFAQQGYEGEADWTLLEELRKSIQIPLIGNGDIRQPEDATRMMERTGCDGVMIGRAAIGNPWFLRSVRNHLLGLQPPPVVTLAERIQTALTHLKMSIDFAVSDWQSDIGRALTEEEYALCNSRRTASLRGQLPLYFKGFLNASRLRTQIFASNSYEEVKRAIEDFQLTSAPDGAEAEQDSILVN